MELLSRGKNEIYANKEVVSWGPGLGMTGMEKLINNHEWFERAVHSSFRNLKLTAKKIDRGWPGQVSEQINRSMGKKL